MPSASSASFRRLALAVACTVAVGVAPATAALATPTPGTGTAGTAPGTGTAGTTSGTGTAGIGNEPSAGPPPSGSDSAGRAGQAGRVTLITGDTVQVNAAGGGRFSASVQPAPGREQITFHTLEVDGGLRVLPSDVIPYLSAGVLDADLFDVEELIADGYGDAGSGRLPLIVSYDNAQAGARRTLSGVATTRSLSSIGGAALTAEKADLAAFWKATATGSGPSTSSTASAVRLGQGIKDIWLDAKVHPTLDRSTAQIGAPAVWAGGTDGTGVTVAVLDTGIDATHPDLSSRIREARSFTGDPDTTDRFGHGTHVASIIAGTGAAAGGTRKGVAPGANLLIGKVLGDDGSGQESWIIDAMEWAAGQASVVNMSLGAGPTDGTDPMSQAVDRITAETGTLFVIAAGNDGADQSVGSPGTATSALTVGAVDRDDSLADFSSRGPRLGDEGLKPEITAPGVGIWAAHAAGTDIGTVDGTYMSLSGTSMATPHVAGAAALLAQVHPTWTAGQLKDALVSTAHTATDSTVFGQGAGRVDVGRAVAQPVRATGVADFGLLSESTKTVQQKTITYTNEGKTAVTLALRLNLTNLTSGARSTTGVSLAGSVSVPAGKSVAVPVSVDPAKLPRGQYSGWITATGTGGVLTTTAVGITLEGPKHTVTFTALNRSGQPTRVPVIMLHGDSRRSDYLGYLLGDSTQAVVEEGTYLLDSLIEEGLPDEQATLITDPNLKVTKDIHIVLDARKGNPIRIDTPKPSEQQAILSYYVHRVTGSGRTISHGTMHYSNIETVNVTPTKKPSSGSYEFSSRWQLVAPMVQGTVGGLSGPIKARLSRYSPGLDGRRRLPLVYAGHGSAAELKAAKVKGAAVVLLSADDTAGESAPSEQDLTIAAAQAGAATVLLVRPPTWAAWTSWTPDGEREPIPTLVLPTASGQSVITRARRGGATLDLTLTTSSPYLYDVQQVSTDRVPERIVYQVTVANSARITARYADNGGLTWQKEQRFGWRPWQTFSWNDASRFVETPKVREEWVTAGDSIWEQQVRHDWPWNDLGQLDGGLLQPARQYQPGSSDATWIGAVVRPASPTGVPELVSTRTGDTLNLRVPEFVDSAGHFSIGGTTAETVELRRDGVVVASPANARVDVPTTARAAAYRLTLTTARDDTEWSWGTRTSTAWDFRSATTPVAKPLSLLQIDYAAAVDLTGRAGSGAHTLGLTIRAQDGGPAPRGTKVSVEVSTDEGASWRSTRVSGSGNCFTAAIPAGKGTVSLRVKAVDAAGDAVQQTVIRAYGRR